MPWDLVCCGFNAHSQLLRAQPGTQNGIGEDIRTPTVAASGESIHVLFSSWADLLLEVDGELCLYGATALAHARPTSPTASEILLICEPEDLVIKQVFGDHTGPQGVLGENGCSYLLTYPAQKPTFLKEISVGESVDFVAIAGNGTVCVVNGGGHQVVVYRNLSDWIGLEMAPTLCRHKLTTVTQLVANEYSFALLTSDGEVYTLGDPRYSLGRGVTSSEPATAPYAVTALQGMRMKKVSSGGWITAALSEYDDVYIWGTRPASLGGGIEFLPESPDEVGLVDLGEGVDCRDVAVGGGHVVVLTTEGEVYSAGDSGNGQAGSAKDGGEEVWRKWEKTWMGEAMEVYCGSSAWSTHVLVKIE